MTTAPTRRVNRGRGHVYFLDGEPSVGVTTILDNGVPKPALVGWAANVTAGYVVDHWEELLELRPSERLEVLKRARWAEKDAAARRGTEVHEYALRLAAGEEVDVPEELAGHVDSYLAFAEDWLEQEIVVEAVVINRRYRYMGTLDVIAGLKDGRVWLLDWKTGGKGIYRETALQLAAYRNAEALLLEDGTERPMATVDAAGAVWLRADGYELVPLETGPEVFRTFLYAQQVAKFSQAPEEAYIGAPLRPPDRKAAAV